MHWVFRIAAAAIWLMATVITLVLLYEFTEGAGSVYFAMMCFAVALASFSLIFARSGKENRNWLSATFGGAAWAIGVTALAVMELGYWDSKQEFISSAHTTESLASNGRQELAKNAQVSLENYKTARPSGEVLAERDAILHKVVNRNGDTLSRVTRFCADPSDHPKECGDYAKLGVELERSREKERLEKQVWTSATGPQILVRTFDISAPAHIVSRWTGIGDATTKDILKGLFVVLLFIGRDGMLFVASAPKRIRSKALAPVEQRTVSVALARLPEEALPKADPVPQISAPVPSPQPAPVDIHDDIQADIHEAPKYAVEKAAEKRAKKGKARLGKAQNGGNVIDINGPFGAVGAKTARARTLLEVVRACCAGKEGQEIIFGGKEGIYAAVEIGVKNARRYGAEIGVAPNLVGSALKELGHTSFKRSNKVHYAIAGGSKQQACG